MERIYDPTKEDFIFPQLQCQLYNFDLMGKDQQYLIEAEDKEEEADSPRIFFKLIEKVGAFGKYQKITIAVWCLIMYLNGGLMFMTPFLFFEDPYDCTKLLTPMPEEECKDFICSLTESQRVFYIPTETIHSLANHFGDYRCPTDKLGFDSLIAVMFFGAAMGFLCLTLFGEMIGRKLLMQLNMASFIIGMILTILCVDVYMAAVGLFLSVLGISNAYIICFYFIVQTISDDYREKMSVICQSFYGVGVILDILWYWSIGNWQIILICCFLVPGIVILALLTFIITDTPKCLVLNNPSQKALEHFEYIARLNGIACTIQQDELIDAREHYQFSVQKSNTGKFSIIDLFKYASTRYTSILFILLFSIICFCFYAPSLMLDEFEFNLYINGLAIGLSQITAYVASYFVVSKARRKVIATVCFAMTGACAFVLIFVWKQGSGEEVEDYIQIIILALIFLFELAISFEFTIFYVYQNEVFPTQARVVGTSVVSLVGEGIVIFSSEIIDLCFANDFPVMILFSSLSLLCILISLRLPETFQKNPQQLILQFREKSSSYKSKLSSKKDLLTSGTSKNLATP